MKITRLTFDTVDSIHIYAAAFILHRINFCLQRFVYAIRDRENPEPYIK